MWSYILREQKLYYYYYYIPIDAYFNYNISRYYVESHNYEVKFILSCLFKYDLIKMIIASLLFQNLKLMSFNRYYQIYCVK
jgi:hypothetical protein